MGLGRVPTWHVQRPVFYPLHCIKTRHGIVCLQSSTRSQKVKVIGSYIVGLSPTWDTQDEVSKRNVFNWKIRTIHSRHGWWLTPVILVPRRPKQGDCPKFKVSLHYKVRHYLNTYPSPQKKKHHIYKPTRELITCDKKKWIFVEPIHITEWGQQARLWHNPPHFKCPTW